jgi:hypothetical protein
VVFSHFGCVYKRSLALENNFYSLNILSSDMASIFGIIKHGKIIVLKESFGFWRKHPFQESKKDKFSKSYIFNYLICWTYILNLNKNCTEEIGLIINNKYINTLNKINQHSSKYVKLYLYFLLVLKYPKYTLNYIYYRFGFL